MFAMYYSSTSLGSLYSLSKYSFHLFRTSVGSVRTLPSSPLTVPSPGACVCVILLIPSYTALVLLLTLLFSTSLHIHMIKGIDDFKLWTVDVFVIVIVNSKLLKRHSKAKRRAPAYSRALRQIRGVFQ